MRRWIVTLALLSAFGIHSSAFAQSPTPPQRVLFVPLGLNPDPALADRDAGMVDALRAAPDLEWFTRVILVVPSWQEYPNAPEHPLVRHALNICQSRGVPVIWGRNLWVSWPTLLSDPGLAPSAYAHYDSAYYVAAISRVKAEAAYLGAVGTFLDGEPYGESVQRPELRRPRTNGEHGMILSTVMMAVRVAGQVDGIYPASSGSESGYAWPLAYLGRERYDCLTYRAKPPEWTPRLGRPPPGHHWQVDWWGSWVGKGALTAEQAKAWATEVIRKAHPECKGQWIYIGVNEFAQIIRSW